MATSIKSLHRQLTVCSKKKKTTIWNTGAFLYCCCYCSLCRFPSNNKRNNTSNFILRYKCIFSGWLLCQHICPHIVCNMQAFSQSQQVKTKRQILIFFWNTLRNLWHVNIQNELKKSTCTNTARLWSILQRHTQISRRSPVRKRGRPPLDDTYDVFNVHQMLVNFNLIWVLMFIADTNWVIIQMQTMMLTWKAHNVLLRPPIIKYLHNIPDQIPLWL